MFVSMYLIATVQTRLEGTEGMHIIRIVPSVHLHLGHWTLVKNRGF